MGKVVVESVKSGCRYLMLGTGFGYGLMDRSPRWWSWFRSTEETRLMACLCDREGRLAWCPTDELRVVSIDGQDVSELREISLLNEHSERLVGHDLSRLNEAAKERPEDFNRCADCGAMLSGPICPKCNG